MARTLGKPLNLSNAISDVAAGLMANAPVGESENVAVLTTPDCTCSAKDCAGNRHAYSTLVVLNGMPQIGWILTPAPPAARASTSSG